MNPDRITVERAPTGKLQFVIRRRHSHREHRHGHHHHDDYHHHHHHHHRRHSFSHDEMNSLIERERLLRAENEELRRENHALKANWQTCDQELRRLQVFVPDLQRRVQHLEGENRTLRRALDAAEGNANEDYRKLRLKYTRVKNDNEKLAAENNTLRSDNEGLVQSVGHFQTKLRDAVAEVRELREQVRTWVDSFRREKRAVEDLTNRNERLRDGLDTANAQRDRLLEENADLRRRLRSSHSPRYYH
jgi:chromosome segregation ATPase